MALTEGKEEMQVGTNYSSEEISKKLDELVTTARQIILQKGTKIELTYPVLYFMSIIDKSIKLIDSSLFALEQKNITVLAILTRVQMDCVFRAYALTLVSDDDDFAKEIIGNNKQINHLKSSTGENMTDQYLANKVGDWLNLPVYDLYKKVCGFVHFSDSNLHTMISSIEADGFSMLSFTKENPPGKDEDFRRLSLELANQFLFFGDILVNSLFDSWVKQCVNVSE